MFSVLVVVLRPDHIAGLGFSSGQREIPLIASLRVLRAPQIRADSIRCPLLRAVSKSPRRFRTVRTGHCFWAILHGSLLGNGRWNLPGVAGWESERAEFTPLLLVSDLTYSQWKNSSWESAHDCRSWSVHSPWRYLPTIRDVYEPIV